MSIEEKIDLGVTNAMEDLINYSYGLETLDEEALEHVKELAISIINTRDKTGPKGGSFVQAVVDNNLNSALNSGSITAIKSLKFLSYISKNNNLYNI